MFICIVRWDLIWLQSRYVWTSFKYAFFGETVGIGKIQDNPTLQGLLTSILELGAWVGVLMNGYVADALGRRASVVIGCILFNIGVIIQAVARDADYGYILGGRFVIGLGLGYFPWLYHYIILKFRELK